MEKLARCPGPAAGVRRRDVRLQGWIRTRRDSKGGFSFLELNDGSCQGNMQVVAEATLPNYESEIKHLAPAAASRSKGSCKASPAKGQATEVQPRASSSMAGPTPRRYPLQKKRHSFEFLRTIAHLRPRTNTFGAIARVRNCVCRSIHDFFQEQGFLYIHTPIITASDCEGAGEMFKVTTLDLAKVPTAATSRSISTKDFFARPAYLTVSGQLQGEIFACALGKVYTFGPTFRAENSNTSRHLAEFWMVEPEMAFFELADNMDLAEAFLKRIFGDVLGPLPADMRVLQRARRQDRPDRTLEAIVASEFVRLPYTEAVEILEKSGKTNSSFPVAWGLDLQAEHERYLTEQHFSRPVILFDYPRIDQAVLHAGQRRRQHGAGDGHAGAAASARSSAAASAKSGSTCSKSGCASRSSIRQATGGISTCGATARCRTRASAWGWNGSMQFVTGMGNIRDVIPFPRTPGSADF